MQESAVKTEKPIWLSLDKDWRNKLSQALLNWFDQYGRKNLPWQGQGAYAVWLSEIMLQQTQVQTVIPYYHRFMQSFPDIRSLARASLDEVLHHWSGLGYYARARHLHRSAQIITEQYDGQFPNQWDQVLALPGIGPSTAAAILSFAFGQRQVILEGNVKRVLCRLFAVSGWPGQSQVNKQLWHLADQLTPHHRIADYNQAIMDLGAMICRRHQPKCLVCPWSHACQALAKQSVLAYPQTKPAKKRPIKTRHYLLWVHEQKVLLKKRPPTGIWGGLWSLPEFTSEKELFDWLKQNGFAIEKKEIKQHRHAFTHFDLNMNIHLIRGKKTGYLIQEADYIWYQGQTLGLAQPIKTIIQSCVKYTASNSEKN